MIKKQNILKLIGHNETSPKSEIYSSKCMYQENREIINTQLNGDPKTSGKEEQVKSKLV